MAYAFNDDVPTHRPDALRLYLETSALIDWPRIEDRLPYLNSLSSLAQVVDPHLEFVRLVDERVHPVGHARRRRYVDALSEVRAMAAARRPLSIERLLDVQRIVLGHETAVREEPAFCRRRDGVVVSFGLLPDLRGRFAKRLAWLNEGFVHPVVAAVRLYLDITFFHPFPDGNARAARLWLDFVLTSHHFVLPSFVAITGMHKDPRDRMLPQRMAMVLMRSALESGQAR